MADQRIGKFMLGRLLFAFVQKNTLGLRHIIVTVPVFTTVQNLNARGTIYCIWIILRKCEGLLGMLGEEYRADLVGVLVHNYCRTAGR